MCLYAGSYPLVHLDNKNIEGDTCKLMLSKDCVDMDAKILNKRTGDEKIKYFHSLLTMSTVKTYLPYVSLYEAEFMQVLLKTN